MTGENTPELGNLLFGCSRGRFAVPRMSGYETPIRMLVQAVSGSADSDYFEPFSNEMFDLRPYYWGDCTCGAAEEDDRECSETCALVLPNFHYKPTDYRLDWYKYPLRDSYANQQVTVRQMYDMVCDCLRSLEAWK